MNMNEVIPWQEMSTRAWQVRENSNGKTKVGAAVYTARGNIYTGCNVEHRYRCHDIHAEVNAIGNMVSQGETEFKAILIVADRDFFTPCGSCMDWIMQHGGDDCMVKFENAKLDFKIFRSIDLMPHYPH
jgi:cytidine deaminase